MACCAARAWRATSIPEPHPIPFSAGADWLGAAFDFFFAGALAAVPSELILNVCVSMMKLSNSKQTLPCYNRCQCTVAMSANIRYRGNELFTKDNPVGGDRTVGLDRTRPAADDATAAHHFLRRQSAHIFCLPLRSPLVRSME